MIRTSRARRVAFAAALAATALSGRSEAQDTTVTQRHLLAIDLGRIVPARRTYAMLIRSGDSTIAIGEREVTLTQATYAGAAAFLITERRTGVVAAAESLFLAPDFRPLHWSSALGASRLAAEFVGDSIYGATTVAGAKHNIVVAARPDLIVSGAMLENLLGALPLAAAWSDSVGALAVDLASSVVRSGELLVLGEEEYSVDGQSRPCWIVALRVAGSPRQVLYWISKAAGSPVRVEQPVSTHVGASLEYRLRSETLIEPQAGPPQ